MMQTLNIVNNKNVEFNAFKIFQPNVDDNPQRSLALLEQLQTTLELNDLLTIFAREAAKYVDFSGLYFSQGDIKVACRGSRRGKQERRFELKLNNQYLGTLIYAINKPISLANHNILTQLHQLLIHPFNNAIQYQHALSLAMQDSLTNLGNRRYFDEQLKRAMHHANRQHSLVGLIVCDLNKFKAINDTYGHPIGDKVLSHFSDALRASTRNSDSIFRFGGDEFALIVEHASQTSLQVIEQRIIHAIAEDALLAKYKVSCSLGATFMTRDDTAASFFERADHALYAKKENKVTPLKAVL